MQSFVCFFRWMFSARILWRLFIGILSVVTLITIAWQFENWRGRTKWGKWKTEWENKGEKFDLASVLSPKVPHEKNLAKSVLFEPLFDRDTNGKPSNQVAFDVAQNRFSLRSTPRNTFGWRYGQQTNLDNWEREFLQLPDPPVKGVMPADTVLAALESYADDMVTLANEVRRPKSRFDIRYEDSFNEHLPHLQVLRQAAVLFSLRASASLVKGDVNGALADTVTIIRLAESIAAEPSIIAQLVRVSILEIGIQSFWEGSADHKWLAAHMVELRSELQPINLIQGMALSFRGERNMFNHWLSRLTGGDTDAVRQLEMFTDLSNPISISLPAGWIYQNQFHINRIITDTILPSIDLKKRRLATTGFNSIDEEIRTLKEGFTPYCFLAGMVLGAYDRMAIKMSAGQAAIDQAIIVTALENHFLVKASYPESLDALTPEWLKNVPGDWFSNSGMVYRLNSEGTFTLYSIGYNETEDDGRYVFGSGKRKPIEWDEGDWPWPSVMVE